MTILDPYERIVWRGETFNRRTVVMLEEVEARLDATLTFFQGSYSDGAASAGTHTGGGAADVWCASKPVEQVVRTMRIVGFAAWHREAIPNLWGEHIHAIAVGDAELSTAARAQVIDYHAHRDGLKSHAPDPTWHPDPIPVFNYQEAIDVQLDDKLPGKSGKTVGDALVAAVKVQADLATFRANIAKRDKWIIGRLQELDGGVVTQETVTAALRDVLGSLDDDAAAS